MKVTDLLRLCESKFSKAKFIRGLADEGLFVFSKGRKVFIVINDNIHLRINRLNVRGVGYWEFICFYSVGDGPRTAVRTENSYLHSFIETEESLEFFVDIIKQLKKKSTIEEMAFMLEKAINIYRKDRPSG